METVFVSMICIALMVIGSMTMARGFLTSIDSTSANIDTISQRNEEIMRTNISVEEITETSSTTVEVHISNIGQTKLSDFAKWDIIIHHMAEDDSYTVTWLPYVTSGPGNNEWTLEGIYTSSSLPEVFDPGILNPDEEMVIEAVVDPAIKTGSENLVLITTPNGVTISKSFTGS